MYAYYVLCTYILNFRYIRTLQCRFIFTYVTDILYTPPVIAYCVTSVLNYFNTPKSVAHLHRERFSSVYRER